MEVHICAVCSLDRPSLLPLPTEHRQLFAAIVSPFITTSDLNACYFLLCMECQMEMLSIHHFQKMALNGVRKLKHLLCNLNNASTILPDDSNTKTSKQTTNGDMSPALVKTPQTALGIVKTEPEMKSPEANVEVVSVVTPSNSNSVTGEGHLKSEPDPMPEFSELEVYLEPDYELESLEFEPAETESESKSELQSEPDFKLEPESERPQCDSEMAMDCESTNLEQNIRPLTQNKIIYIIKSANAKQAEKEPNTVAQKPRKTIARVVKLKKISKEEIIARMKAKVDEANAALEQRNSTAAADAAVAAKKARTRPCSLNRKRLSSVQCPDCDKVISDKWGLRTHYLRVHAETKPVKCDVCDKQCRNDEALKSHKSRHNTRPEPNLFCEECSYKYASKASYDRHLSSLKHTPREQYKFECEVCKMKYPKETRLREHVDVVHRGLRKFKCESCGKGYTEKSKLRRHVRSAHEQHVRQKTFVCEHCGKAFMVKKSLTEHLLVHQGLRPHKCKLCPAVFTYRAALYTHNQLKHLKKKGKKTERRVSNVTQNTVLLNS